LIIVYFSNHLSGQDILHVIVYDEDSVVNEKIGSIQIDLNDLYEKGLLDDILLSNSI
jgi:Ca2+-dependent lipid-binding protein